MGAQPATCMTIHVQECVNMILAKVDSGQRQAGRLDQLQARGILGDDVFAMAIALLALDLAVPERGTVGSISSTSTRRPSSRTCSASA